MRFSLTLAGVLLCVFAGVFLTVLPGCNKPAEPVEMSPPPDPPLEDRPQLTEISPVSGEADEPMDPSQAPLTLSEASQGRPYSVVKGDTYWRIAASQLGNGHRWKEIQALNPGVNMNALKVGQTIQIPVR